MTKGSQTHPQSGSVEETVEGDHSLEPDASLTRHPQDKEEEVKFAELESRLRAMITDMLRPSITRTTRLEYEYEDMVVKFHDLSAKFKDMLKKHEHAKEQWDLILVFKQDLQQYLEQIQKLDVEISAQQRVNLRRIDSMEQSCDARRTESLRLSRGLDHLTADVDLFHSKMGEMQASLENQIFKANHETDKQIQRLDADAVDARHAFTRFSNQIWGDANVGKDAPNAPPCLYSLARRIKATNECLGIACEDIVVLKSMEGQMEKLLSRQCAVEKETASATETCRQMGEQLSRIAKETKADFTRASNLIAAWSASLLRQARTHFNEELAASRDVREEVVEFMQKMENSMGKLGGDLKSQTRHVEAILREVRLDLEGLDGKRKRDKQLLESQVSANETRTVSAMAVTEEVVRGLEHVTNVVDLSLQSDSISIALELQDFVERKQTPLVGVSEGAKRQGSRSGPRGGLDPQHLVRITYDPAPISYEGHVLDRTQLIELREKIVGSARRELEGTGNGNKKDCVESCASTVNLRLSPSSTSDAEVLPASSSASGRPYGALPRCTLRFDDGVSSRGQSPLSPGKTQTSSGRRSSADMFRFGLEVEENTVAPKIFLPALSLSGRRSRNHLDVQVDQVSERGGQQESFPLQCT